MPSIELTDDELQGFVQLCATASGPGINWVLTNALLTKARQAQENAQTVQPLITPHRPGNSEDHDASVPRP